MTKQEKPRITIAIPTLNRAHCVARAVESALSQTMESVEIIVSNNGSMDGTAAILESYRDPRLTILHHQHTMEATTHGNLLLEQARGLLFVGLSDDDYLEPDFCSSVDQLFERHQDLAFIYTSCLVHYANAIVRSKFGPPIEDGLDFMEAFYRGDREVCWCGCASRTDALRAIGLLPTQRICGDMYYWTRLAFLGNVGCIQKPLAHYTQIGDNMSSATPVLEWTAEARATADDVLNRLARSGADDIRVNRVRQHANRFLARTCANQFAWNAMRGVPKYQLARALPDVAHFLVRDPRVWPRVAAALALPPDWVRAAILAYAQRRGSVKDHP